MAEISQQAQHELARIQTLYDAEMAAARPALTADDVPLSYEAITSGWLTAALCHNVPGAKVDSFTLGAPDEGTTNRRKIAVIYNDIGHAAGLAERLFCKSSFGLPNRFALGPVGAIAAEVDFYNYVRPKLAIEATEGLFANINDAFNSIVITRDISANVLEFCDHRTEMTKSRAESQIRVLATLHGAGASKPAIVACHGRFRSWFDFFHGTKMFGLDQGAQAGFDGAEDLIPAKSYHRRADFWPSTEEMVYRSHQRPATVTHGDVHLKNWYIAADGAMGLSDWQCTTIGHWGRDLAYTIGTALTIENRRAWERDLIALYLDELAVNGGASVSFDEAWGIYREQMLPALAWWTFTLIPPPGVPDMQPKPTAIEFVRRMGTAIDDLDSFDA